MAELLGNILPPGLLAVIPGGRECGEALTMHPDIAKVTLIGSVATGKAIATGALSLALFSVQAADDDGVRTRLDEHKDVVSIVMLFVPSSEGISHNEAEDTSPSDACVGVDVLTASGSSATVGSTYWRT